MDDSAGTRSGERGFRLQTLARRQKYTGEKQVGYSRASMQMVLIFIVALAANVLGVVLTVLFRSHLTVDTIAKFAPVASAGFAALAASGAAISAWYNSRSARATLFLRLADDYGSEEMGQASKGLHEWAETFEDLGGDPAEEYILRYHNGDSTIEGIHWMRRRASHFYTNVWALAENGLIDDDLLRSLIGHDQATFFLTVIRPMDVKLQAYLGRSSDLRIERFFKAFISRESNGTG